MPTVLRSGPYRFYAGDRNEPLHVHVERDDRETKVWLDPVRLEYSRGFGRVEINRILSLVESNRQRLVSAWNAYFNG